MLYGNRIKEIRTHFGESQKTFGERIGVTSVQVSLLESEQRDIKIDLLRLFEDMGINTHWFITGEGEMFKDIGLGSRIQKIREYKEWTLEDFAERLGISKQDVDNLEQNRGELSAKILSKLHYIGINIDWILNEHEPMIESEKDEVWFGSDVENTLFLQKRNTTSTNNIEETIYVKRLDIKASAGVGFINPLEQSNVWIGLPESFIHPYNPHYISLLEATGSSMEPVIRSGDLLLVSEQDTELLSERIYIIRMGEELKVKRIVRLGNGNIVVWSENESFGREEFTPQQWEEYGMSIVARVVKIIKEV